MESRKTKKSKNKRLIICSILVIAVFVITFIGIFISRKEYSIHTNQFSKAEAVLDKVKYGKEGIIEVTGIYVNDHEETIITVRAVGEGETSLDIDYSLDFDNENKFPIHFSSDFKVNAIGAVIEKQYRSNFNKFEYILYALLAILSILTLFMMSEFIIRAREGRFGYTMVACGGGSIFAGLLLLFLIYKYLNNVIRCLYDVMYIIGNIGLYFLFLMIPVMFVMSAFLALSNIWLIKHEGKRLVNTLGIIFGIIWFAATFITLKPEVLRLEYDVGKFVNVFIIYVSCFFESMFISTVVCSIMAVYHKPAYDMDYIIILGCCIRKDGSLTPLLKGRVDSAIRFEKEQYEKTGKHAVFVPSGGQGPDEIISEGEAMEKYLLECGIPKERIAVENRSINTLQNMAYSKEVIEKAAGGDISGKNIAFATTNYHVFRGYIQSEKSGFHAEGISAKTKRYFYPNAFLREFIGLIYGKMISVIVYLVLLTFFFVMMFVYTY